MTEQDVAPAPEAPAVAAVSRKRLAFKIGVRLVILGGVLAFGWFVLLGIFDDLDLAEVRSAMSELSDASMLVVAYRIKELKWHESLDPTAHEEAVADADVAPGALESPLL